jgi:hypothetical protein
MQAQQTNHRDLCLIAAILAAALVGFELWMATTPHDNSRSQHLGGAVAYAKGHIDLMRPMLLGFNANGTPTPLEFPLWQAATAVLMKMFGLWFGWGNIVSLVFFFSSLWALFDLCRRLCSPRVAWWAVVFSLAQPLSFTTGGQAGGDSTAWAAAMWFIYYCERMMSEGKIIWWLFALLTGGLCAVTKGPFFMCVGLVTFFWLCLHHRRSLRAWLFLSSCGVVGTGLLFAWNYHCHLVYTEAVFQTINMDSFDSKSGINHWYFGTLAYRLNLHNWVRGGWHLMNSIFGGLSFVFLLQVGFRTARAVECWLWLLAAAITTMVFPTLMWEHVHYFFVYAPVAAWLCALGAAEFEPEIWKRLRVGTVMRTGILMTTLIASLTGTFTALHVFNFDSFQNDIAHAIKEHTSPSDKLIVWGTNWGDPFLRADREGFTGGLSLDDSGWFNDPQKLARVKQMGYNKIVLINASPFIVALTSVNGQHGEKLVDLHQHLPSVAKNWPVEFDSLEVLIVKIP